MSAVNRLITIGDRVLGFLRRYDLLPWLMGVSVLAALSVGLWAILSPAEAGLNGLVLVGGIAVLLFIAFYGLATGTLPFMLNEAETLQRPGPVAVRQGEPGLFMKVLEAAPEAYLVTTRSGAVLYANRAYEELTRAGHRGRNMGRPLPLEQVFVGDEGLAAPLYRLARGARLGLKVSEILRFKRLEGGIQLMHASVTSIPGDREHMIWRIADENENAHRGSNFERVMSVASQIDPGEAVDVEAIPARSDLPNTGSAPLAPRSSEGEMPRAMALDRFALLFAHAPVGMAILSQDGVLRELNGSFEAIAAEGVSDTEVEIAGQAPVGRMFTDLVAQEDRQVVIQRLTEVSAGGAGEFPLEISFVSGRTVQIYASAIDSDKDTPAEDALIVYLIDMTEHKLLEEQYTQSQKLQAVGQLAGGVAHDFNNLLTAIIGFSDLLLTRHQVGDPSFDDIDKIRQSANRAANLVRQLLAFSRQQTLTATILTPTDVLTDLSMLLRRLLGETVTLDLVHGRDLGLIKIDQNQLDTALINLAVNARHAMEGNGTLSIRTRNFIQPEARDAGNEMINPGHYVLIEVADTGCGIAKENLQKIFEPFFTTKGVGEGTGLGLSTVYGIIKQMDGYVFLDSEIGKGTTFQIYLPVYIETAEDRKIAQETKNKPAAAPRDLTGMGTILLVEDEEAVRAFSKRALSSRGYTVLEAPHGVAALEVIDEFDGSIDLMVSDVVMPEMDGPTLAKHVRERCPETKMIFISGYAEDVFRNSMERPDDVAFLPKPFSLKQLVAKVKDVLGQ